MTTRSLYRIVLMDDETERKSIPEFLEGFATVIFAYKLSVPHLRTELGMADAIVTGGFGKVSKEELDFAPRLKIIAVGAAGYEKVDVSAATSRGIIVTRAATADIECVAEHAIGFMIMLAKKIPKVVDELKRGNWKYRDSPDALGSEIFGKTMGIVGFGKVGRALAKKASGMGMDMLVFDPYVEDEVVYGLGAKQANLQELLTRADYVCLATALTKETSHLVGARELGLMKRSAFLINIARGGLVDEEALYVALQQKRIAGAALDVLESEPPKNKDLLGLDNCIVTPHIAGVTAERRRDIGRVTVDEVKRVLAGGLPIRENWINPDVVRTHS
jgi:D-3-phosphoglycerate dehydrogenase / 2-oxoglutarate reductase